MIAKRPDGQRYVPAPGENDPLAPASPVVGRMPPKRTSILRVRYMKKGKGRPRAYRLDE
jgi:hypothetical protein